MKHIIKVEVLENLPTIRPLIAMDKYKKFFAEGKMKEPAVPNNEIWYTSSDGNIVTPFRTSSLPEIDTNTYSNGKGVIKFKTDVTTIGNRAFSDCSSLTSINIPNSVSSIAVYAFRGCSGLTSITIPNSVMSIGSGAFYNVFNVEYLGKATGSPWDAKCVNGYVEGLLVYQDSTKTTLSGCHSTATGSIIISSSVTHVGDGAFYECAGLTSITIPNSVTSIGYSAFEGCSNITSVTLPDNITSIEDGIFYGCSSLTSVTIPNNVTRIGGSAFRMCASLTSMTIPDNVTSIGEAAFAGCSSLTAINIPDGVTDIGGSAFSMCSGLASITIPNNVVNIGNRAFNNCSGLLYITCKALTPPTLGGTTIFDNTNNCPIYVPTQSIDEYKAAENWSEYASRIVGLLNNNQIRYTANSQLTIKDGVDYTDHTFEDGVGIVTFTNDLTTLKNSWLSYTFVNYTDNLTSLTLPNGVSDIEMGAFDYTHTIYYEGTQKECAKIVKGTLVDSTGINEYHCFDGIVDGGYISNTINPILLGAAGAVWFPELIGNENAGLLIYNIASVKIDEYPMTAGEFITAFVNGTAGTPELSTYGFTVVNQEYNGITIPLAYHTESGHFIGIAKATDYAYIDFTHIAPVAVNESLDPDYMYMLLDDTIITQGS